MVVVVASPAACSVIVILSITTTNFGSVLDLANERFGTNFARYQHTPAEEEAVRREVEHSLGVMVAANRLPPSPDKLALPTLDKMRKRKVFEDRFAESCDPRLLEAAEAVYTRLIAP